MRLVDLREVRLDSLTLAGGASGIELRFPRPWGTVWVRILGGASHVTICRPDGVAPRAHASGGATDLTIDEKHFGAIGGDVNMQSPEYDDALSRYGIDVTGGANSLTIDPQRPGNATE